MRATEDEFNEVFSALTRHMLVEHGALCHFMPEEWRGNVIQTYGHSEDFDALPAVIARSMGCEGSAPGWTR